MGVGLIMRPTGPSGPLPVSSVRGIAMLCRFDNRLGHYILLISVSALLCLPNLGGPSLWDIDEGNNAECAQEMYESGNFIVPTFNYKLRVDKPVLLYWLQVPAYHVLGVTEF